MSKVLEAQEILKAFGLQEQQQNEMSALTLLALCNIKEEDLWRNATNESKRISNDIMAFVNENYKKDSPYAPNTRETFRRHVLHQFAQSAIVRYNPDNPDLPVNSPKAHYALTIEALDVIKSFKTREWNKKLKIFSNQLPSLRSRYSDDRNMRRIPLVVEGQEYQLSPGAHNQLQADVINEFAPRFAAGGKLLYIGDTEDKDLYVNTDGLNNLNLPITEHSKLPDIIISDELKEWLFLIEVVTSHGPISSKRLIELEEFTKDCPYGIVYVTAFPDNKEFRRHAGDIAWETEVWLADTPDHMIHFNGDRFIGPRR